MLDQEDALSNLQSAEGGLEAVQARLSQAKTNAKVTHIQTDSTIEQAQSALSAALAKLEVVKKPARTQEKMVAENRVESAKANLENAEANYKRHQLLLKQGAIAESAFDVAKAQYGVASADYRSAKEQLSLVQEGGRSEDIRAAESQVAMAREQLRAAKANASQNLLRQEDIKSAQASIRQARSVVALARQQLENTYIKSPITGRMASRTAEPGQVVSPGQPLAKIVNLGSVYFKGDISEKDLESVEINQTVRVKIDAKSDVTFTGRVTEIYPTGSTNSRSFPVRITIDSADGIKPGMFARGGIITGTSKNILLIPKDAIDNRKGTQSVFTVEADKTVKRHVVDVISENRNFVQIRSAVGLTEGQAVVTQGCQNLQQGMKVEIAADGIRR
jgi:RND family efflux transporter MFP subunit